MDHKTIESKWRKIWKAKGVYKTDLTKAKKKFYNLMMFPYPSAEGMHVGNMYAFTGADIYGRFQAMRGFNVFEPIGLDGFGIHSENYAIKINKHPVDQAKVSQKRFYDQLERIGNRFSWDHRLETYDPEYYRWTQWLFVQMFKHKLAYRKQAQVNWCPSCKTVLADEQVIDGQCERCHSPVEKRETEQWFFRITKYADRLLDNLKKIDWPKKIKIAQEQWIGRSEGVEISWEIALSKNLKGKKITTFTTRPDTIYGATFLVLAPDHPLVGSLALGKKVLDYVQKAILKTEQQRKLEEKKKSGVPTDYSVVHPLTGKLIPIWIADFVLKDYGTGAVMGVPAHDERDMAFAKKYKLPVIDILKDKEEIIKDLEKRGLAKRTVNYHLRDWLISRQRYWGPPIPMIYCANCANKGTPGSKNIPPRGGMLGWFPEDEKNLPVKLPYLKNFKPTSDGQPPLERAPRDWLEVACPECGGAARRETEVSDTFLDSSWYFLRYPSIDFTPGVKEVHTPGVLKQPFDPNVTEDWLPVDAYIGGAEHAVLHLLYSRFVWMALQDWGYLPKKLGDEPFPFLYGHGLIIKDGAKMSKSRGNVVIPDKYIDQYGADVLRLYLMFIGPYHQGGDFRDTGMRGMSRFLVRVEKLCGIPGLKNSPKPGMNTARLRHQTIKRVTQAMKHLRYNVAIAALMEYVNGLEKQGADKESLRVLLLLLAPLAPYLSEELWFKLGGKFSIHQQKWPEFKESLATSGVNTIVVVQVNGKYRGGLEVKPAEAKDKALMIKRAKFCANVAKHLTGKTIIKEIFVPGRLVNLVVE